MLDTGLPGGAADAVMCVDAVQFGEPPLAALREFRRLLKPGRPGGADLLGGRRPGRPAGAADPGRTAAAGPARGRLRRRRRPAAAGLAAGRADLWEAVVAEPEADAAMRSLQEQAPVPGDVRLAAPGVRHRHGTLTAGPLTSCTTWPEAGLTGARRGIAAPWVCTTRRPGWRSASAGRADAGDRRHRRCRRRHRRAGRGAGGCWRRCWSPWSSPPRCSRSSSGCAGTASPALAALVGALLVPALLVVLGCSWRTRRHGRGVERRPGRRGGRGARRAGRRPARHAAGLAAAAHRRARRRLGRAERRAALAVQAAIGVFVAAFVLYYLFKDGPAGVAWLERRLPLRPGLTRQLVWMVRRCGCAGTSWAPPSSRAWTPSSSPSAPWRCGCR
ncbi:hypothetical protein [Streptomyces sp. NBC_00464]|uniref:hypothetical protein n=1 Tax=Streptomyces sp. NBC_00464 TaxID=2975751 RepID=UPI003FA7D984